MKFKIRAKILESISAVKCFYLVEQMDFKRSYCAKTDAKHAV